MRRMSSQIMPHRRRREQRTDYRQRLRLLKSRKMRFVVRGSVSSITCQIVSHDSKGDRTIVSASSLELRKHGWKGHTGNIPAAYLTGFLCGQKAKKHKVKEAVMDMGLHISVKGSRIYATLKGAIDSGLDIPHSGSILPPEDRIKGGHISKYAEHLKKENPDKYATHFSHSIKSGLLPEDLARHFDEIKQKLAAGK